MQRTSAKCESLLSASMQSSCSWNAILRHQSTVQLWWLNYSVKTRKKKTKKSTSVVWHHALQHNDIMYFCCAAGDDGLWLIRDGVCWWIGRKMCCTWAVVVLHLGGRHLQLGGSRATAGQRGRNRWWTVHRHQDIVNSFSATGRAWFNFSMSIDFILIIIIYSYPDLHSGFSGPRPPCACCTDWLSCARNINE